MLLVGLFPQIINKDTGYLYDMFLKINNIVCSYRLLLQPIPALYNYGLILHGICVDCFCFISTILPYALLERSFLSCS